MESEINLHIELARESMEHALEHLQHELNKIKAGKASTSMLGGIMVPYYGAPTPLANVANVSSADARTLIVQPWEKKIIGAIEKAIFDANLGLTPQNDGSMIRISIPPLTEERRRDLAKKSKLIGEDGKVSVRNARRDVMEHIRKEVKNGFSEDLGKKKEEEVQAITNKYIEKVDRMIEGKEREMMTV